MQRYETDYYAWLHEQAGLLAGGHYGALDIAHLVEELALMAETASGELYNRLAVLLAHLLKLQVTPGLLPGVYDQHQRGWRLTCRAQRRRLARLLNRNPSLRPRVPEEVREAYEVARLAATAALQVDEGHLPDACPWTAREVLNEALWPEETG
jgi:Domain of unknown function DUF29